jgi:competence protein ComEC
MVRADRLPAALLVFGVAAVTVLALAHSAEIRSRAEAALGEGMPPREAALARGFVLGGDERIDAATIEDFRRSGLGHLLAVSGQNVALLALLAMSLLAALGLPLRARLIWILGLIVVYVVLAGAGPSIQRAGTMGALSVLATLSGRRSSRLYGLAVAAIVTLGLEPRVAADPGWQLSFAAVLGILLLAAPLRRAIQGRLGAGAGRRAVADGAAMTIAATLATAPLIAHRFGTLSTTTLFANLLALPAVAPAMWLGMLAAIGGQLPGFPVAALNSVNALLLAYVAQVAAWCARPEWAYLHVRIGIAGLALSYLAVGGVVLLARALRRVARPACLRGLAALAAGLAAIALASLAPGGTTVAATPPAGLRVSVLDVGQGDAILLQPRRADPVLVDGGPPAHGLLRELRAAGVERLAAAVVSHDQSDHVGGIEELLGAMPVDRLLYGALDRRTSIAAREAGALPGRLVAGDEVRAGGLRLEVLWPPGELLSGGSVREDPNRASLVLLLRWHDFSMLLTGDAEAEATPLDPGPVDVLKVAHHGSEDAGLGNLLERTSPRLAIVSVGEGNPFGHPTAATLRALVAHGVATLRTDRDGTVVLDVRPGSFRISATG